MMTTTTEWGRFPSQWIMTGGLIRFNVLQKAALASLRVYLAMACWNARKEADESSTTCFSFNMTYTELQRNSHSDRSEILPALKLLEENGLLNFSNNGRGSRNLYVLQGNLKMGWAKVPVTSLERFPYLNLKHTGQPIQSRRQILLDALKLYLLFLAFRNRLTNRAIISYDRICELTGIRRRGVRAALSLLVSLRLIHIDKHGNPENPGPNHYFLMDLASYRPLRTEDVQQAS